MKEDGAAALARKAGFLSIGEFAKWCDVKEDTLKRWVYSRPVMFECLLIGARERKNADEGI